MSELQRIVDSLARTTRRAVSVHDRTRNLLAFSSHDGAIDDVRKESILTRKGPARGYEWAKGFGIETTEGPVRIPANGELGMEARMCAPVRYDGRLLGFLWLVDPEETLPDEQIDFVRTAAESAAMAIHHQELAEEIEAGRERELLRDLLSEQADVRQHAATDLVETEALVPAAHAVVLVVRPLLEREPMQANDTTVRSRIETGLTRARRRVAPKRALHLVRPDHGVLLVACEASEIDDIGELGTALHEYTLEALGDQDGWGAVVGIGDPRTELADCHRSYDEARKTSEVCGVLTPVGPVARWSQLGVYQILLRLPLSDLNVGELHPGLSRLLASRDSEVWLRTLDTYLDLGCDARGAAQALHINRSSLYHRIHRIEQIAEVDLGNGDDRLVLHLGLKLARLSGLLDTVTT
jgi:sugar diacid utilization regulator